MYLFAFLLACTDPSDTAPPTSAASGPGVISAPLSDIGFGASLAYGEDGTLWIGAPFGSEGIVYAHKDTGPLTEMLRGDGKLGAALAASPTTPEVVVSAPLADGFAGTVSSTSGAVLATGGSSLGLSLTWADGWVAAHASGWRSADRSAETLHRPSAIAAMQVDGRWQIGVSMAHGGKMLQVGDTILSAPPLGAEAGYALATGDVDNDGEPEWVVGAPGSGQVYIVSADATEIEHTLSGGARFGHALAVADVDEDGADDLVVGAPMARDADGAVHFFASGALEHPTESWVPNKSGAQLGFAVAARPGELAAAAPGAPDGKGFIYLLTP